MNMHDQQDESLDRGLRAIGEHLPEPAPSPDTCARLTRLITGGQEPAVVCPAAHRGWGGRLRQLVGGVAALLVLGGLVWMVLAPQPSSPEGDPIRTLEGGAGKTLVSFHHDQCSVAKQMAPRVEAIANRCNSALKVDRVDMTEWGPGEAPDRLRELGFDCVLRGCQMPTLSGLVVLLDEDRNILARCRGDEPLDEIITALDE